MNMLRKILFFGLMTVAGTVFGQNRNTADKVDRPNTKKINFGVRAGFNSSMFMVSELKIKDVTIDEVQNNYKIGYFGALFMRINMKKHYIQPEVSYNVTKCEITFDKLGSQHPAIEPDYASVQSVLHSIDFPVLYGYNVVKKGPYGMSIFAGPKLRYLWGKQNEITFTNFDQKGIHEKLYPLNVSVVIGVGVNISRIFFDFRYEHRKYHQIVRQLPDDLTEQAGVEDDAALLVDLSLEGGADAGLHIVARHGQPVAALHQNALQCGDRAFGGHGTGHGIDGALQQRFFAGETEHILLPFLSNDFCHASQKENIN